jgi:hypothetical protein
MTNTFLDQARNEPPIEIDPGSIPPSLRSMSPEKMNEALEFFLNPDPNHKNFGYYLEHPKDWETHKAQIFAAAHQQELMNRQDDPTGQPAPSVKDLFNLLSSRYEDAAPAIEQVNYRKQLLGDEAYAKELNDAKDDFWVTTFGKGFANALLTTVPGLVGATGSLVNAVAGDSTQWDERAMKWAVDFNLKHQYAMREQNPDNFSYGQWFFGGVGSGVGSIAAMATAGVAGAAVGTLIAPGAGTVAGFSAGAIGAVTASTLAGYSMAQSNMATELYQKTGDLTLSNNVASVVGVPVAMLDRVGFTKVVGKPIERMFAKEIQDRVLSEGAEAFAKQGATAAIRKTNSEMYKEAVKMADRLVFSGVHDAKKGLILRSAGGAAFTEAITEGMQSFTQTLGEAAAKAITGNEKLDGEVFTRDNVKGWAEEAFFGAVVGGGMSAGNQAFSRPEAKGMMRVVVEAAKRNDPSVVQRLQEKSVSLVKAGKMTQAQADSLMGEVALVNEAATTLVGGIEDVGAQNQLVYLHKLKKEVEGKVSQSADAKATGPRNAQLTSVTKSLVGEIDKVIGEIQKGGKAVTYNHSESGITKLSAFLNGTYGVGIDMQQGSNSVSAHSAGAESKLADIYKKIWSKDRKDYDPALIEEIKAVEKETGVTIPKDKKELQLIRDMQLLETTGMTLDEAVFIKENVKPLFKQWQQNRKSDSPSGTLEYVDAEGRKVPVDVLKLNTLFKAFEKEKVPPTAELDYFIEQKQKAEIDSRTFREGTVDRVIQSLDENMDFEDAYEGAVQEERAGLTVSDAMVSSVEDGLKAGDIESGFGPFLSGFRKENPDSRLEDVEVREMYDQRVDELKPAFGKEFNAIRKQAEKAGYQSLRHAVNSVRKNLKKEFPALQDMTAADRKELSQAIAEASLVSETARAGRESAATKVREAQKKPVAARTAPVAKKVREKKPSAKRKPPVTPKVAKKVSQTNKPTKAVTAKRSKPKAISESELNKNALLDEVFSEDTEVNDMLTQMVRRMVESGEKESDIRDVIDSFKAMNERGAQSNRGPAHLRSATSTDARGAQEVMGRMASFYAERFGMTAQQADSMFDDLGFEAVAMATEAGIFYSKNAGVDAIPHEYAHVYLRMLQETKPTTWSAIRKFAASSPLFAQVEAAYPELSGDLLMEEVMATMMGRSVAENMSEYFSADPALQSRAKTLIRMFWQAVKKLFRGDMSGVLADVLAARMTLNARPFTVPSGVIRSFSKHAYSKAEYQTRRSIINAVNRAVLANEDFLTAPSLAEGRNRAFFTDPRLYITKAILEGYVNGEKGLEFINRFYSRNAAFGLLETVNNVIEAVGVENKDTMRDLMVFHTMWKMASPEDQQFFNKVVRNTHGIPAEMPTTGMGEVGEYSNLSVKRVVMGMMDYNGDLINPDDVTRVVYDAAIRSKDNTGFVRNLKNLVKKGDADKALIAELFLDRVGGLVNRSGKSVRNEKVLAPLLNIFRSMTISRVVNTLMTDGLPRRVTMNRSENVNEVVEDIIEDTMARMVADPQRFPVHYARLREAVAKVDKQKGTITEEQAAAQVLNAFFREMLASDLAMDPMEVIDRIHENANVNRLLNYVVTSLRAGSAHEQQVQADFKENGADGVRRYLDATKGVIKWIAEASVMHEELELGYTTFDGKPRVAQGFSTSIHREVAQLFEKDGSRKAKIDRMLDKGDRFYRGNPILKLWKELGTVTIGEWTEGGRSNKNGTMSLDEMRKQGVLADNLMGFLKGRTHYDHMYGLNGTRESRYIMPAPKMNLGQIFAEQRELADELEWRLQRLIERGKLTVDEAGLQRVNDTYPIQFKIEGGRYVQDFDATSLMMTRNAKRLMVLFNTLPEGIQKEFLDKAMVNPIFGTFDELSAMTAEQRMLRVMGVFGENMSLNDRRMSDIFMGDLMALEGGAKQLKRGMGQGSKGMRLPIKDFYLVVLPDPSKRTDAQAYYNLYMNRDIKDAGGKVEKFGNNHKLHIFGVQQGGENSGLADYIKHAAYGLDYDENGVSNFAMMDTEGHTDYSEIERMMKEAETATGEKNPRIVFAYESAVKALSVPYTKYEGGAFNSSNVVKVSPSSIVVNFNINNDYTQQEMQKRLTVQVMTVLTDHAEGLSTYAEKQDFINRFHQALVDVMNEQSNEYFGKTDRHNNEALAQELVKKVFENDMQYSSATKLEYLNQLFSNDSKLFSHISDPNLFNVALGKLTQMFNTNSFNAQMEGGVLQTVADRNNTLRWNDENGMPLANPEVMVPQSIGLPGELVILIRVPSTGPESMFVGRVVGNTHPSDNIVKVPEGFILASDADHDGDALHAFKRPADATKAHLWDVMREAMTSETFIGKREEGISLEPMEQLLGKDMRVKTNSYIDSLETMEQVMLGRRTVGVFANAKKTMTHLADQGVVTFDAVPIKVGEDYIPMYRYGRQNLKMIGELLQASLDNVSKLFLTPMGIRMSNIGEAVVLMSLEGDDGQKLDHAGLKAILNGPVFRDYGRSIESRVGPFEESSFVSSHDRTGILNDMRESGKYETAELNMLAAAVREANYIRDVMHILDLDDGIKFGVEKALKVQQSFRHLRESSNPYARLFDNILSKHQEAINDQFIDTVQAMSLEYGKQTVQVGEQAFRDLGARSVGPAQWKATAAMVNDMLDRAVMSRKYSDEQMFIEQFGQMMWELKHGSQNIMAIGSSAADEGVFLVTDEQYELAVQQLEGHEDGSKRLSPDLLKQRQVVLAKYLMQQVAQDDVRTNTFLSSLRVYRDKEGSGVSIRLSRKAANLTETERALLKEDYDKLPIELTDFIMDYVTMTEGMTLSNSAVWSFLGTERAEKRYRLAGELIQNGMNASNRAALSQNILLNSPNAIRRVKGSSRPVTIVPTGKQQAEAMSVAHRLFPLLTDDIFANSRGAVSLAMESSNYNRVVVTPETVRPDGTVVAEVVRFEAPRLVTMNDNVYVLASQGQYEMATKTTVVTYIDITQGYEMAKGKKLPFELPGMNIPDVETDHVMDFMRSVFAEQYRDREDELTKIIGNQFRPIAAEVQAVREIQTNRKQYDRIVKRLRKDFPFIEVMTWDEYSKQYSPPGVGQAIAMESTGNDGSRALQRIVSWSTADGSLDTPPHEYAHHYVRMFINDPLIQKGLELYGNEERLVQAVGESYVKQLGVNWADRGIRKFAYTVQKFISGMADSNGYARLFWAKMQSVFGSPSIQAEIVESMLDGSIKEQSGTMEEYIMNAQYNPGRDGLVMKGYDGVQIEERTVNQPIQPLIDFDEQAARSTVVSDLMKNAIIPQHNKAFLMGNAQPFGTYQGQYLFSADGGILYPGIGSPSPANGIEVNDYKKALLAYVTSLKGKADVLFKNEAYGEHEEKGNRDQMLAADSLFNDLFRSFDPENTVVNMAGMSSNNIALGLLARIHNPNDPLDNGSMEGKGLNVAERMLVDRAYRSLIKLQGNIKHMEDTGGFLIMGDSGMISTADTVAEIGAALNSKRSVFESLSRHLTEDSSAIKRMWSGLVGIYQNAFFDLSAKVMMLTGDKENVLFEVGVTAFKRAESKFNRAFTGTRTQLGGSRILQLGYAEVQNIDDYRYDADAGFTNQVKEKFNVKVEGQDVQMTLGEMLQVYLMANHIDPQTGQDIRMVLKNKEGGIQLQAGRSQTDDTRNRRWVFSEAEIEAIEQQVESFQGGVLLDKVVPSMREMMDGYVEPVNEAYRQLMGRDMDSSGNYLPMFYSNPDETKVTKQKNYRTIGEFNRVIDSLGLIGSGRTLMIKDAFDVMEQFAYGASAFHAYAVPIRNFTRLVTTADAKGKSLDSHFKEVGMENVWEDVKGHVLEVVNKGFRGSDMTVDDSSGRQSRADRWTKAIYSNLTISRLAYNIPVAIIQNFSMMLANDHVRMRYLAKEFFNVPATVSMGLRSWNLKNLLTADSIFDPAGSQVPEYTEMVERSPDMYERFMSGMIDPSMAANVSAGINSKERKILGVLKPSTAMGMIKLMDMVAHVQLWKAVKAQTEAEHPGLAKGSDEYWTHVTHFFEEAAKESQPSMGASGRSRAQMNPGSLLSYFYMFGSQRQRMQSSLIGTWYQMRHNPSAQNRLAFMRNLSNKAIWGSLLYVMTKQAEQFIINAVMGKETELAGEEWDEPEEILFVDTLFRTFSAFASMFAFGDQATFMAKGAHSYVLYGDKQKAMQAMGHSSSAIEVAPVLAAEDAVKAWSYMEDNPDRALVYSGRALGNLTGFPIYPFNLYDKVTRPE